MATDAQQALEVAQNFDFFQRNLSKYLEGHKGQYALLRSKHVHGYYDAPGDAYRAGRQQFPDELFSIQEVTDEPIDLGFFSHVAN